MSDSQEQPGESEASLPSVAGDLQDLSVTISRQFAAILQGMDMLGDRLTAIEAALGHTTDEPAAVAGTARPERATLSAAMRELADGVAFWHSKANWPDDFHNDDYKKWAQQNPRGEFTDDWWTPFRRRLWDWIAIRPASYADVNEGLERWRKELSEAWHVACEPVLDSDITEVRWEQVRGFPDVVGKIKPMRQGPSPVFTSKFCHFLLPRIFPVVDNEAMKNTRTYERYFRYVQDQWALTAPDDRVALTHELTRLIELDGRSMFAGFPIVNKIVELRIIGRCYPGMSRLFLLG